MADMTNKQEAAKALAEVFDTLRAYGSGLPTPTTFTTEDAGSMDDAADTVELVLTYFFDYEFEELD